MLTSALLIGVGIPLPATNSEAFLFALVFHVTSSLKCPLADIDITPMPLKVSFPVNVT